MHHYVCILNISILLHLPSFDVKAPLLLVYGLEQDILPSWLPMIACGFSLVV